MPKAPRRFHKAPVAKQESFLGSLHSQKNVVELDPDLIDASFVADRLAAPEDPAFVAAIRDHGQQVPILVRPSGEAAERFQIAYGRRRLQAAKTLGVKVRTIVRELTDEELVIAQGQENAVRTDLGFIERAMFAHRLEGGGFRRETIMAALHVDKTALSRLIAIASKIPRELLDAIGPAPQAGRPRWLELVERLEADGALQRAHELAQSADFKALATDARFARMLACLAAPASAPDRSADLVVDGETIVAIKVSKGATALRVNTLAAPEFGRYLVERVGDIYRAWKDEQGRRS